MSKFAYAERSVVGEKAEEAINNIIALHYQGEIQRISTGDAIEADGSSHNEFLIGSGTHEGLSISKPLSTLWGAPGAIINRLVTIDTHTVISNIYFKQEDADNNIDHLVRVTGNARVLFSNCIFQRKYNAPIEAPAPGITKCFVLVDSGSSATFQGCVFRSSHDSGAMNGVGTVVQNANGAAAPALGPLPGVYVIGGMNLTTHAHGLTVTRLGGEV